MHLENYPTYTPSHVPPVAQPVRQTVDFNKAAQQQNHASKTHTVYNKGVENFDKLAEQLKSYGRTPDFKAEQLGKLEIYPEMTVREALDAIDNYNKEGKKQVDDIARKNIRLDSQIKEEKKVHAYTERLWNSVPEETAARDTQRIHFRATIYPRYPSLHINPFFGAAIGFMFNGLSGAIGGALFLHLFNQLKIS